MRRSHMDGLHLITDTGTTRGRLRWLSGKAALGLGVTQVVIGCLVAAAQIAMLVIYPAEFNVMGHGVWCGAAFVISGSFGIVAGKRRTLPWAITSMVLSIIVCMGSLALIGMSVLTVMLSRTPPYSCNTPFDDSNLSIPRDLGYNPNNGYPYGDDMANYGRPYGNGMANTGRPYGNDMANNGGPYGNDMANNGGPYGNDMANYGPGFSGPGYYNTPPPPDSVYRRYTTDVPGPSDNFGYPAYDTPPPDYPFDRFPTDTPTPTSDPFDDYKPTFFRKKRMFDTGSPCYGAYSVRFEWVVQISLNSFMALMAFVQFIIAIVAASLMCAPICCAPADPDTELGRKYVQPPKYEPIVASPVLLLANPEKPPLEGTGDVVYI